MGDASINYWANSIRNIKAKKYDIKMIVPGHGSVGKSDILDHTIYLAESASNNLMQQAMKAPAD
jgi:flavorubredoxin